MTHAVPTRRSSDLDDRVLGQCAGGIGCLRGCERGDEGEQQDGQGAVHCGLRRGWTIRGWMNLQEWSGLLLVGARSEEHTSELQSLIRIPYAAFRLTQKQKGTLHH